MPSGSNTGGEELPVYFSTEPLVGHRLWRVAPAFAGPAVLKSLNLPYIWDVENTAKCLPQGGMNPMAAAIVGSQTKHEDPAPSLTCQCGLYAQLYDHPLSEWTGTVYGRVHASGSVALSGRVIECDFGYKAQYATIISPVVLEASCYVRACDGTPSRIGTKDNRTLTGHCPKHDIPGTVQVDVFMAETIRQLSTRYEDVEFLSWNLM